MKKLFIILIAPIMIPIWLLVVSAWWLLLGEEGVDEASRLWVRIVLLKK